MSEGQQNGGPALVVLPLYPHSGLKTAININEIALVTEKIDDSGAKYSEIEVRSGSKILVAADVEMIDTAIWQALEIAYKKVMQLAADLVAGLDS